MPLLAVGALLAAAATIARPARRSGQRRARVLTGPPARRPGRLAQAAGVLRRLVVGLPHRGGVPPVAVVPAAAGAAAAAGLLLGGPVAAVVAGAYAGMVAFRMRRRAVGRRREGCRTVAMDALCALAADLRAGLPPVAAGLPRATGVLPPPAAAGASSSASGPLAVGGGPWEATVPEATAPEAARLLSLGHAAWRLAERTGAPLADLLERIESDARAARRSAAAASAQAAGAQATAWLLAGLPVGGIALGYGVGVDPLRVLLHTPIGAACALGAMLLQFGGLIWADRLVVGSGGAP